MCWYFEGRNNTAPGNGTSQALRVHQESHEDDVHQTPRRFEPEVQDYERCQCLTASERDSEVLCLCAFLGIALLLAGTISFAVIVFTIETKPLELGMSITIVCCVFVYVVYCLIRWRHSLTDVCRGYSRN